MRPAPQTRPLLAARATSPPVGRHDTTAGVAANNGHGDWAALLARLSTSRIVLEYGQNDTVFMQGQPADSLYFLLRGKIRLTVATHEGKEAIVAPLGGGDFFGEGCLAG